MSTALDCQARWDFRYGDQLAGSSLKEKSLAPLLSGGRAWGAAVAAWHTTENGDEAGARALAALDESLQEDADRQREFGVFEQAAYDELRTELLQILLHHVEDVERVQMDPVVERELLVPIPSRTGEGDSSKYRLLCYLDATSDGPWIEEFKLRGSLTNAALIAASRQIRWYGWAFWKATGVKPTGVWVNERLRDAPKPARILKSGKPSHAKDQMTTPERYLAACADAGEEPHDDVVEHLKRRDWHQRVPVLFRDSELEEVERELVSAAKLIRDLDRGELYPLRNAKRQNCSWCPYRDICPAPDNDLVEALFERRPAKRNRSREEQH